MERILRYVLHNELQDVTPTSLRIFADDLVRSFKHGTDGIFGNSSLVDGTILWPFDINHLADDGRKVLIYAGRKDEMVPIITQEPFKRIPNVQYEESDHGHLRMLIDPHWLISGPISSMIELPNTTDEFE